MVIRRGKVLFLGGNAIVFYKVTIERILKGLADFFQVNKLSVLNYLALCKKEGIEGLKLKPSRGRKPKLDIANPQHVAMVKELIQNDN